MNRTWAFLGWLFCLACGPTAEEPPGEHDRTLGELDQSGADALCEELDRQVQADQDYVQLFCTNSGLLTENFTREPCASVRARCLADVPSTCSGQLLLNEFWDSECPRVTVAMFLDCRAGARSLSKQLYADFTCASPAAEAQSALFDFTDLLRAEAPPGCEDFKRSCPMFFEE